MDSAAAGSPAASSCAASALQWACTSCRSSFLSRRFSRSPAASAAAWTGSAQNVSREHDRGAAARSQARRPVCACNADGPRM